MASGVRDYPRGLTRPGGLSSPHCALAHWGRRKQPFYMKVGKFLCYVGMFFKVVSTRLIPA